MRRPLSLLLTWVCLPMGCGAVSGATVTIDELASRTEIPLAAISPDGRYAAYLWVCGIPSRNEYDVTVHVRELDAGDGETTLATYHLPPEEAFDEVEGFLPGAGDLRWSADHSLLFLDRSDGRTRLLAWDAKDKGTRIVVSGHDRITLASEQPSAHALTLWTTDALEPPPPAADRVSDRALRIRDGYWFESALRNPVLGHWVKSQKYRLGLDETGSLSREGVPEEGWDVTLPEWAPTSRIRTAKSSWTYRGHAVASPDGKLAAAVETGQINLADPDRAYSSSRIILLNGDHSTTLVPFTRPRLKRTILGWAPGGVAVYYVEVGPRGSNLNRVTTNGEISVLYRDEAELAVPGEFFERECTVLDRAANTVLLVRSTNTTPAELIAVALGRGQPIKVSNPNQHFVDLQRPEVRFYWIDSRVAQGVYGRLYLPLDYVPRVRYPLVVTHYYSQPGFYAATGDEVPILPLTANGIAVFAMQSSYLSLESRQGDFRLERERVRKPLAAMQWIVHKLVSDGIVNPDRVGLTGLSYGAEIATYAYAHSKVFRTISVASGSFEPCTFPFSGVTAASRWTERGFQTSLTGSAIHQWREISAGLNARATLPPLLIQSADGEENFSVPTWFALRRAGAQVEWLEYPNEGHVKRDPANKWWVYSRNLDWFRFWLKDEEDPDPRKVEQYQRWRQMRAAWEKAMKEPALRINLSLKEHVIEQSKD